MPQDIFVISHSPSGMETGKSKSEERSKLLTDPAVTSIAYEINKANKQLNQHRLQVPMPGSQHDASPAGHISLMCLQQVLQRAVCALGCSCQQVSRCCTAPLITHCIFCACMSYRCSRLEKLNFSFLLRRVGATVLLSKVTAC